MELQEFKRQNGIKNITYDGSPVILDQPGHMALGFQIDDSDMHFSFIIAGNMTDASSPNIWCNHSFAHITKTVWETVREYQAIFTLKSSYKSESQGFYNGKTPQYNELAEHFKDEYKLKNDDTYRCIFQDGFYRDLSKTEFSYLIDCLTNQKANGAHVDNFRKAVSARCFYPKSDFNARQGLVNLNNGVIDVKKRELMPHSDEYNFRYKLAHDYDSSAEASAFTNFLDFVFEGDKKLINLIGEIMGYTLVGGDPFKHKAFVFYGDGRNGKSTLLDVIRELLGAHSVSSVSMRRLNEPFSAVRMDGKLANIVEESPGQINSEAFKNIVGGGLVTAAKKHMDEFELKVNARLFFACNDFPHFKDTSEGLKSKLIIIPFNRFIREEERDSSIKPKLFAEMSGILNFALKGYERLIANGYQFTEVDVVNESMDEYLEESDSVTAWAKDSLELNFDPDYRLSNGDLYRRYKTYCSDKGYSLCNDKTFGKRFKRYMVGLTENQFSENELKYKNDTQRGYRFLKFTSPF